MFLKEKMASVAENERFASLSSEESAVSSSSKIETALTLNSVS